MSFDLVQLQLIVKGHQADPFPGGVLDVRDLLARIGIDDSLWGNTQLQDGLDFSLGVCANTQFPSTINITSL